MAKKVMLVRQVEGRKISEECMLLSDDDTFRLSYTRDSKKVSEVLNSAMEKLKKDGMVLFQDKNGVFCVHMKDIVYIENLEI